MHLEFEWSRPIRLKKFNRNGLGYDVDLNKIEAVAGVYIIGRQYGASFEALYVGRASGSIRSRVRSHLNNLRLMQHLSNAKSGKRVVLAGRFATKGGQNQEKCLKVAERTLIRHFLAEGHDLVNKQGTRLRRHEIHSSGKHPKRFFPRRLYSEKAKGD